MKINPECVACLIKRALYEANLVDPDLASVAVAEATNILAREYNPNDPDVSARIASKMHARVYEILSSEDPYAAIKDRSNKIAVGLLPHARELVEHAENPLWMASLVAVAGNVLDFGIRGAIAGPEDFEEVFDSIVDEGYGIDHTPEAFSLLGPGKKVAYLTDNCGEVVFDSIFWEILMDMGVDLTVVVKGKPILTDATLDDIEGLGLKDHANRFFTTGTGVVGLERSLLPQETLDAMLDADLIISKGMANFEALSEEDFRPIIYLMRTKCQPIASHANAPLDANVAKLYR